MITIKRVLITGLSILFVLPLAVGCGSEDKEIKAEVSYEGFKQTDITFDSDVFKDPKDLNRALGINFGGIMGTRMENVMNRWMYTAYYANPAMIEMLRQRESKLKPVLQAWYGEFPGKYLTSAAYLYAMNHDSNLKVIMDDLVDQLESAQTPEGYLGPFSHDNRLTGNLDESLGKGKTWDLWGHYHIIRGLLLWHRQTGSQKAVDIARKAADYIIEYFQTSGKTLSDAGESEKNLSVAHGFAMLYRLTEEQKYLDFANACMDAWELPGNGDFYREGVSGTPFYQLTTPRWEGFHSVLALAEMYHITGSEEYKNAFVNLWKSLRDYDRHNTGGATTGERAVGTPYQNGTIETCCTVAWASMTAEAAKLMDDPAVIDELELTTFNGILGAQSPSGRWFTYNTPMDGERKASSHEIVFQAIPGSPELNCCSVNGPVGLGLISEWAVASDDKSVTLNYYGDSKTAALTPSGGKLIIQQETNYPAEGNIKITILAEKTESFALRLRVPSWSKDTSVKVNGNSVQARAGSYLSVEREWKNGDTIELNFDMSPHFWKGAENRSEQISIYVGPLLLAADERFNESAIRNNKTDPEKIKLKLSGMKLTKAQSGAIPSYPDPIVLYKLKCTDGKEIMLCDFATAGMSGTKYATWLPVSDAQAISGGTGTAIWTGRWR